MGALDDFLVLESMGTPLPGNQPIANSERPTLAGLKWLDAPSGVAGLAYRVNGSILEQLSVTDECDDGGSASYVACSCPLRVGAVHIAASQDGRMVSIACVDGSLQCFDSTPTSLSLRWTIQNAHSHVSRDVWAPVSTKRSRAACACGPVLALSFSPEHHFLLLVDAEYGLVIYDARAQAPSNSAVGATDRVSSASWCASSGASLQAGMPLAVGRYDGTIAVFRYTPRSATSAPLLQSVSEFGSPSIGEGFSCTHLNWAGDTLVAGLYRVTPPEEDEDPDEDEQDDTADHEACLYVTTIDESSMSTTTEWVEQRDAVPFFAVPKYGRHVYFTSFLRSSQDLIAVASNVGESIGAIAREGAAWTLIEFQEGSGATTPTNEDDEFTYPVGISIVQLPSSSFRLLVAATDGSLSVFAFENTYDPNCFAAPVFGSTTGLPNDPVAMRESTATPPLLSPASAASPSGDDNGNGTWVVVEDETDAEEVQPTAASPACATPDARSSAFGSSPDVQSSVFGSNRSAQLSFGTNSSIFGSGSQAPSFDSQTTSSFGSGTAGGLTFGTGTTSSTPYASFGKASGGSSLFGATSPLGGTVSSNVASNISTPTKPGVFGSSPSVFGSGTGVPTGGFAALSASPSNTGTGAFGSDPFNAFQKPAASSTGVASMAKPLFGSSSISAPTSSSKSTSAAFTSGFGFGVVSEAPPSNDSGPSVAALSTETTTSELPTALFSAPVEPFATGDLSTQSEVPKTHGPPRNEAEKAGFKEKGVQDKAIVNDSHLLSQAEAAAVRLFDQFDGERAGSIPVSHFEAMSEELGEGFYGDEYEAQIALIDPSSSGTMTKSAFIQWYKTLTDDAGDGNDSLDTEEREERDAEEKTAKKAFEKLSKTEDGVSFIPVDRLNELIELLGATYCEEEHVKTIRILEKPGGRIYELDFLRWYIAWLFGGDEDVDEGDAQEEVSRDTVETSDEKESLESLFKYDKDSWKCDVCSVRNLGNANACVACETPRPGYEDAAGSSKEATNVASTSITAGGFSFGGGMTSSTTNDGGVFFGASSFGGDVKPVSGGFTFRANDGESSSDGGTKGGFLFSMPKKDGETKATTADLPVNDCGTESASTTSKTTATSTAGFLSKPSNNTVSSAESAAFPPMSIAAPKSPFLALTSQPATGSASTPPIAKTALEKPLTTDEQSGLEKSQSLFGAHTSTSSSSPFSLGKAETGKSSLGFTLQPPESEPGWVAPTFAKSEPTGSNTTNRLVKEVIKDQRMHDENRASEASKSAALVFDKFDTAKSGSLPVALFEELSEEMGEGLHGDEYDAQITLIDPSKSGQIAKGSFIRWYESLVQDDREGDAESLDTEEKEERAEEEAIAKAAFGKLSKSDAGRSYINGEDFAKLIESLGTTYCEEEHVNTLQKLKKAGERIYESDFLSWYIGWLFGGDQGEDDAAADVNEKTQEATPSNESLETLFKYDANSWKCQICSVRNEAAKKACAACETPRPGLEGAAGIAAKDESPNGSSIGTGGFVFGGDTGAHIGTVGYTFGGSLEVTKSNTDESTSSSSGFVFSAKHEMGMALGGKDDEKASNTGAAPLPPMSKVAPTPFSGLGANSQSVGKQSVGSSSFPPMSKVAPKPFSAVQSTEHTKSNSASSAYPPLSTTAPKPFSALPKSQPAFEKSNDGSSKFPPMSATAPKPFSLQSTPHPAPKISAGSAAFPPMSAAAPKPFSALDTTPAATKRNGAGFPPIATDAPKPFSVQHTLRPAANHSGDSFTALPRLAKAEPTPFSVQPISQPVAMSKIGPTAVFPPTATAAPKAFDMHPDGVIKASVASPAMVRRTYTESFNPFSPSDSEGKAKTKVQLQFVSLTESFNRTISKVAEMKRNASADVDKLQCNIEKLVKQTNYERSKLLDVDECLRKSRTDSAFVLSRKTDASRQVEETAKLLETIKLSGEGSASIANSQPLDNESERDRRKLTASARLCVRRTAVLRGRAEMVEAASADPQKGYLALLEQMMALFKESQHFEQICSRIEGKIADAEKKSPLVKRKENRSTGQSTYSLDHASPHSSKDNRIRAIPFHRASNSKEHMMSNKQNMNEASRALIGQWRSIESSLQKQGRKSLRTLRFDGVSAKAGGKSFRISPKRSIDSRKLSSSLLLSPSPIGYTGAKLETLSMSTGDICIFSPPSTSKARSGWDRPAAVDQGRLKQLSIAPPSDLKQTTLSDASRDTLASFGTTPEKLQVAVGVKWNEIDSRTSARAASSSATSPPSKINESRISSTAGFPPLSNKAPVNPFSKGQDKDVATAIKPSSKRSSSSETRATSNDGFPPMASKAPTNPFANDAVKAKPPSSFPPLSVASPTPFPSQTPNRSEENTSTRDPVESKTPSTEEAAITSSRKSSSSVFGNMKSLGDSLFSSGNEPAGSLKGASSFAFPSSKPVMGETSTQSDEHEYKTLLTNFYQEHNPGKLAEVDRTLEKYKVGNVNMPYFGYLAFFDSHLSTLLSTGTGS